MLGTGLVMRYANGWPVSYRTGATFVHDWLSYGVLIVVLGHLYFALRDPIARRGMRTGRVPDSWARREHRDWAEKSAAERRRGNRRPAAQPPSRTSRAAPAARVMLTEVRRAGV